MNQTADLKTRNARPVVLETPNKTRWVALGAVAGPVLFTLAWFVLGFLSRGYTLWDTVIAPYSPISQPVSGLGLGSTGPFMNAGFVLSGLLLIVGVIGVFQTISANGRPVARRVCAGLLALSPVGLVIDGIYHLDAFLPHLMGFLLGVGTPVVSFLATGLFFRTMPRLRRFGNWLLVASPVTLVLLVIFFQIFDPMTPQVGVAGLLQRVLVLEVHAWFLAMGWMAFRSSRTAVRG
ncbi:MAG: hypothetical protein JWQ95_1320 [Sphaerisporangium sp.]|jgi:hypothetical membrane protein|nr:hypothetical protein [Sphaerisporangium sp.]